MGATWYGMNALGGRRRLRVVLPRGAAFPQTYQRSYKLKVSGTVDSPDEGSDDERGSASAAGRQGLILKQSKHHTLIRRGETRR